jgi:prepilin-type N-terminal cleavage/methylation domain-containing protein
MRKGGGFTLLEMIAVIVVLSVGIAGLAPLFGNATMAMVQGQVVQEAAQHAQDCADRVLGIRRASGFNSANINTTMCDPAPTGFTRTVALSNVYTGAAGMACPTGVNCRDVVIAVNNQVQLTLLLVSY